MSIPPPPPSGPGASGGFGAPPPPKSGAQGEPTYIKKAKSARVNAILGLLPCAFWVLSPMAIIGGYRAKQQALAAGDVPPPAAQHAIVLGAVTIGVYVLLFIIGSQT